MLKIGLTPARTLMWVVPVLVVMIVSMVFTSWWFVPTGVFALLWIAPTMLEVNGASLYETMRRGRETDKAYEPVSLREVDGTAVLLEDGVVSVWLEVMPRETVDVTVVAGDGVVSRPFIDLSKLSPLMRQSDVVIDSVVVNSMSYDTYLPGYAAGNAIAQSMGKVAAPTGGRTWINVRARVEDNLAAAEARSTGEFDMGMIRAVLSAVARLRVVIEEGGHHVVLLSPDMIRQVSSMVQAGTGHILDKAGKGYFGDADSASRAYALYPRRHVTREQTVRWRDLPSTRMFTTTTLTPAGGTGDDTARVTDRVVLVTRDGSAKDKAAQAGLSVLSRQQRQSATWLVPAVVSQPVAQPSYPLEGLHPVLHYGGGMGTYLGSTKTGGGVFVRVRPGSGKTLHLIGDDVMHQVMVMRMLMESHSINVLVDDDNEQQWAALARRLRTPLFAVGSDEKADFVVTTPQGHAAVKQADPDQCIVVVSASTPNMSLENSVHVKGTTAVVTTETDQKTAIFSPTPSETAFLSG